MLGAKIRAYLDENGIKMVFLADKTGLPYNIIVDICCKGRKVETMEYVKICEALKVPLETFIDKVKTEEETTAAES